MTAVGLARDGRLVSILILCDGAFRGRYIRCKTTVAYPGEAIPILERRLEFSNQRGVVKKELKAARKAAG